MENGGGGDSCTKEKKAEFTSSNGDSINMQFRSMTNNVTWIDNQRSKSSTGQDRSYQEEEEAEEEEEEEEVILAPKKRQNLRAQMATQSTRSSVGNRSMTNNKVIITRGQSST